MQMLQSYSFLFAFACCLSVINFLVSCCLIAALTLRCRFARPRPRFEPVMTTSVSSLCRLAAMASALIFSFFLSRFRKPGIDWRRSAL